MKKEYSSRFPFPKKKIDSPHIMNKALLIILDGFGHAPKGSGNAVTLAKTPFLDSIRGKYPMALIKTCGNAVGLPEGAVGASEPGHLTIGAGRVVWQPLEEIHQAIVHGKLNEKHEITMRMQRGKPLHLIGMISDGGVHSHIDHLFALLKLAKERGVLDVFIHTITDGRDVPERSAAKYLEQIETEIKRLGIGKIASLCGRFDAMDRDTNWDRTKKYYDLLIEKSGKEVQSWQEALEDGYKTVETDYYLPPYRFDNFIPITPESEILIWNFRSDRSKQITSALCDPTFSNFDRAEVFPNVSVFGPFSHIAPVAFPPNPVIHNLGSWLADHGKKQLRIAETEKYAHVTFFFNSQEEKPYSGEDRILVPSPKCESYAEKPEMSAYEVTEKVCTALATEKYDFVALNYANPDLVGHSGNLKAAIRAVEVMDECLSKTIPAALDHGYSVILTADHGNVDVMVNEDGSQNPSHSMNLVECFVIPTETRFIASLRTQGGLSDIAPTILSLMQMEKPKEMTGVSLIS